MTCCGSNSAEFAKAVEASSQTTAEQEFRAHSQQISSTLFQSELVVPQMHCAACIGQIEKSLNGLQQVESARANLSLRRVSILWNHTLGDGAQVVSALNGLGFESFPSEREDDANKELKADGKKLLLALAVAGFASANIMLFSVSVWSGAADETAKLFHLISGLIAVPAVAIAGRPFFGSAIRALSVGRLNMDVPISLAVLLALSMGVFEALSGGNEAYFDACVMLLFFLLIGRYLDHLMREKARSSVSSLAQLTAKGGLLVHEDGSLDYIPQDIIKVGQTLRIMPGERFPVDGRICSGRSDIDRSLVTGESTSILAEVGDVVEAGVLNLTSAIDILAVTDAHSSFLSEVMKMMTAAENGRGKYVRIAERAASIYAPAVHLLALITFIGWMFMTGGDWRSSLYSAIAVLIITCPCALGLAVPVVHVIGANRLLKEGILMRDGSAFERLSEIDEVAFDKTGTLTLGSPTVSKTPDMPRQVAETIGTLSSRSSHPVSIAFQRSFQMQSKSLPESIAEVPGFGVQAKIGGKNYRLGRPSWVEQIAQQEKPSSKTASAAFAEEGGSAYYFELSDDLRVDAEPAVAELERAGLNLAILSGDNLKTVEELANRLSIANFQSDLKPIDKLTYLEQRGIENHKVLMVGDGLNDAPALAAAHVSMAPASASEVGRLASDFIFTRGSLKAIPFTWTIARQTKRLIQQNFAIAILYNCIAVPFAIVGLVTPLFAAIAMSLSSIVVVANSMRLNVGSSLLGTGHHTNTFRKSANSKSTVSTSPVGASS